MFVIKPIVVTDAMLTSSIAEPDTGETEWAAGTFTLGQRRIKSSTHRVYEVVADPSTTDDPEVGVSATPATWVDVGPTNRWAMFDLVNSTQSINDDPVIDLAANSINNSIAGINIDNAESVNVTVTSPSFTPPYTKDIDMVDNSAVDDFYDYFFAEIVNRNEFILSDLPAYEDTTITVTIMGTGVAVGSLILGNRLRLGTANYGSGLQDLNFGSVSEDSFGNVTFTRGNKAKLVDFDVTIDTAKVNYVFKQLQTLTDTPTVWYATGEIDDPTLVYGYHRDSRVNISAPSISDCTIQVRGLV